MYSNSRECCVMVVFRAQGPPNHFLIIILHLHQTCYVGNTFFKGTFNYF